MVSNISIIFLAHCVQSYLPMSFMLYRAWRALQLDMMCDKACAMLGHWSTNLAISCSVAGYVSDCTGFRRCVVIRDRAASPNGMIDQEVSLLLNILALILEYWMP